MLSIWSYVNYIWGRFLYTSPLPPLQPVTWFKPVFLLAEEGRNFERGLRPLSLRTPPLERGIKERGVSPLLNALYYRGLRPLSLHTPPLERGIKERGVSPLLNAPEVFTLKMGVITK
jgi:hypothetical protein